MQKCLSTILAILLLFGGSGIVFGQHFCEGVVVDKAFTFGPEKMNCTEVDDSCENNPDEDDCCSDVYFQIQTDTEFPVQWGYVSLDLPQFISSESVFFFEVVSFKKEQNLYTFYAPPDRSLDKQVLYQTYLI